MAEQEAPLSQNIEDRRGDHTERALLQLQMAIREALGLPEPPPTGSGFPDFGKVGRLGIDAGYFDVGRSPPHQLAPVVRPGDIWDFYNLTSKRSTAQ